MTSNRTLGASSTGNGTAATSVLTTERTIQAGEVRAGSSGTYRMLTYRPGEPHMTRSELAPEQNSSGRRRSLLRFAHVTDVHIVDPQSPGRYEFLQRYAETPDAVRDLVPAHRPQEALHLQAVARMLHTLNRIPEDPGTGTSLELVILTGDITDNKQRNELRWFISLTEGGRIDCGSDYQGVQAIRWSDPHYWHPDLFPDKYTEHWGFPEYPGLLDDAMRPFDSEGLRLPWLSLYGNHDALILGTAIPNAAYEEIVTGPLKSADVPSGFSADQDVMAFVWKPEVLLGGPALAIAPDPERRSINKREFIEAHLAAAGTPPGHGFTPENLSTPTEYYVYDASSELRMIMLDTTNPGGYYEGSLGMAQYRWLEQRLIEVHSHYHAEDGSPVDTGHPDRLVVICSHHNSASLTNPVTVAPVPVEDGDLPRLLEPGLGALLHRFPNVILWINGHIHRHVVRPHHGPAVGGFWEITTASLIDWPSQARLIEILDNGDGTLSLLSTILDHDAPPRAEDVAGVERLASIHREVAANDPHAGLNQPSLQGRPEDRNVEMIIRNPLAGRHVHGLAESTGVG